MKDEISKTATVAVSSVRDERQERIFQWCCDAFGIVKTAGLLFATVAGWCSVQ